MNMRIALLWVLLCAVAAHAAQVTGVVKDPSGGAVAKAEIAFAAGSRTVTASSDAQGRFEVADLPAGTYNLTVTHDGFERYEKTVVVGAEAQPLSITLPLARVRTTVEVASGKSPLRNSDPNYKALRGGGMRSVYRVQGLTIKRDIGTFTFRSGAFSFLPPVLGQVTAGVFIGDGNFAMKPAQPIYAQFLKQMSGADAVDEDFGSAVFYFTDATFAEITAHAELADESAKPFQDHFERLRDTLRSRDDVPQSYLRRMIAADDMPNMDAEMLAEIENKTGASFRAFFNGKKHSNLRFVVNPMGAMPQIPGPDEVALIDYDFSSNREGIWYLAHTLAEQNAGGGSAHEEKRLVAPEHYKIEAGIARSLHLSAVCEMRFHPLREGVRVVKFELLPDLQVSRIYLDGKEIPFVQESRKQDGSFYVTLPAPLERFRTYRLQFEYEGGEMIRDLGGKLYTILPRQAWYPRAGAASRSTFEMTFRVPRDMTVVATGRRVKSEFEGGQAVTQWKIDEPVPVAGFNYGAFDGKSRADSQSGVPLDVYLGSKVAGFFTPSSRLGLDSTESALAIFQHWFGELPLQHLSISEANMSDSMPGLLFVPTVTMTDSSSRYASINTGGRGRRGGGGGGGGGMSTAPMPAFTGPVFDESLPRQVARQWWGNLVSPASFHDEWIVQGLTDFAGSAYDLTAEADTDDFAVHWRRARDLLLSKTYWGVRRNDAAPIWLGTMAQTMLVAVPGPPPPPARMTFRVPFLTPSNALTGMKGGFVIHMLRSLMFDNATGDRDFIAMMRDFAGTFANHTVSTEEFQFMVEKHMKPTMNLGGNRRMDWFFRQWVYGTEIPSYRLEYSISKGTDGKPVLHGKLAQSGVSDDFRMEVPIYAKFTARPMVVGRAAITGNSSQEFEVKLPAEPKKIQVAANYDVLCPQPEVKQVK